MTPSVLPCLFAPPKPAPASAPVAPECAVDAPTESHDGASFAALVEARRRKPEPELEADDAGGTGLGVPVAAEPPPQLVQNPSRHCGGELGRGPTGTVTNEMGPVPAVELQPVSPPASSPGLPAALGWLPLIARGADAVMVDPRSVGPQELAPQTGPGGTEPVRADLEMQPPAAATLQASTPNPGVPAPQRHHRGAAGRRDLAAAAPAPAVVEGEVAVEFEAVGARTSGERGPATPSRAPAVAAPQADAGSMESIAGPEISAPPSTSAADPASGTTMTGAARVETGSPLYPLLAEPAMADASAAAPASASTAASVESVLETGPTEGAVPVLALEVPEGTARHAAARAGEKPVTEVRDANALASSAAESALTLQENFEAANPEPGFTPALSRPRPAREIASTVAGHVGAELAASLLATPIGSRLPDSAPLASPASGSAGLPLLDASALAATQEQITQGLARLVHIGRNTAEIHLDPPELGKVRLRLEVRDGTVTGSIEVERTGVLNAMQADMRSLVGALEKLGIHCDRLDIQLLDPRRGQERRESPRPGHEERDEPADDADAPATTPAPQPRAGHGRVDYWL